MHWIFQTLYDAMDPLNEAVSGPIELQVELYKKAGSEEELTWFSELDEMPRITVSSMGRTKINMVANLAVHLINYCKAKNDVWAWKNDKAAFGGITTMINCREAARRTLAFLQKHFNMDFDSLLAAESWKIWLLNPASVDKFSRIKTTLSPHNYEVFRDVVYNEILADLSVCDILQRRVDNMLWLDLDHANKDIYEDAARQKAQQFNEELVYYQYADDIDKAFAKHHENMI